MTGTDLKQTQAVHRLQREQQTLEGLLGREERRDILRRHQKAQRLLRPLMVVNPYAKELTFPDRLLRTRRGSACTIFAEARNTTYQRDQESGLDYPGERYYAKRSRC
jgi:hypothetical protein